MSWPASIIHYNGVSYSRNKIICVKITNSLWVLYFFGRIYNTVKSLLRITMNP